jgi:hypothetical protein
MLIRTVSSNGLFKYRKKSSSYTKGCEFLGYTNYCWLLRDNCPSSGLVPSSECAEAK